MSEAFEQLKARAAEIHNLFKVVMVLGWDQRTMMPPGGAVGRAAQLATVTRLWYEALAAPELGELLAESAGYAESLDYDSDDAALYRFVAHEHEKNRRVDPALRGEMARAASEALPVWDAARKSSDFESFRPYLERNFELRREYVAAHGPADEPYDHLLDDFEPRMKTAEVRAVLDELKEGLVPLIQEISEREPIDASCLEGEFPLPAQHEFERRVLDAFGFDPASWRLDETTHPFASGSCITDIRITTRHRPDDLHSIFSCMHEFGHGLYERQIAPELDGTLLARGTSLSIHESQSRMWENLVGRSRPFWRRFYPDLQECFPSQFGGVDLETFYRAINAVRPGLIRIESDEATYNLHIVLRFELEQELLGGAVDVADVPEVWNARMKDYLGVDVPDVADGVLQDMHWAAGHIGYFSTYTLGNIVSCQLWERIARELPDLEADFERGEFGALREWLRENVHRHGRKYPPRELLERVVGTGIDPQPYLRYLRSKLGEIYSSS
jgi:carboxypeptidase Taq